MRHTNNVIAFHAQQATGVGDAAGCTYVGPTLKSHGDVPKKHFGVVKNLVFGNRTWDCPAFALATSSASSGEESLAAAAAATSKVHDHTLSMDDSVEISWVKMPAGSNRLNVLGIGWIQQDAAPRHVLLGVGYTDADVCSMLMTPPRFRKVDVRRSQWTHTPIYGRAEKRAVGICWGWWRFDDRKHRIPVLGARRRG